MQHGSRCPNLRLNEVGGREGFMPQEYHGPFVRDWDFMLAIVRSDVCTCLLNVMENLNSRTLVEDHWESHGSLDWESDWRLAV